MASQEVRVSSATQWMGFVGILFVLIGLYGALRIIHVSVRGVPYPYSGVLPSNLLLPKTLNFAQESQCDPYPQVYYDYGPDGKQTPRPATQDELNSQEQQRMRCIAGFNEDRSKQEQRDKNESAFLIFVGAGLFLLRRFVGNRA
ncbi:MAG: hypothetical protein HY376_00090 [Candidatus Blackburnbacteria bacterium]|nr:hypothetical protein [Candidatus Blackburnbacteria bacterium]